MIYWRNSVCLLLILVLLAASSLAGSGSTNSEVEDSKPPPPPQEPQRTDDDAFEAAEGEPIGVKLVNNGNAKVKVFWISHTGESVPSGHVAPGGGVLSLNSFVGHRFRLETRGETEDLIIRGNRRKYDVGGNADANADPEEQDVRGEEEETVASVNSFATALPVKFRNICGRELSLWYDDGSGPGQLQAHIGPNGEDSTTNSYPSHKFCFAEKGDERGCQGSVCKAQVNHDVYTYVCDDGTGSDAAKEAWRKENAFNDQYRASHGGKHWIARYPNPKPKLHMHEATRVGEKKLIPTSQPLEPKPQGMKDAAVLTMETLATSPRAFLIEHFLSQSDVDFLVGRGMSKVQRSLTGDWGGVSDTRTSKNTWLTRNDAPQLDKIFRRAADLLSIDESILTHGKHPMGSAENLQLVHYSPGEKYDAHYDWGVEPGTRYITLLLYLNDPKSGGETSFPRAKTPPGYKGPGLLMPPKKGSAVLFYNLLPDGNADVDSLHAALPVHRGEKWLANFWIRDKTQLPGEGEYREL